MKLAKVSFFCIGLVLLMLGGLPDKDQSGAILPSHISDINYSYIVENIDKSAIIDHVRYFSSLGSRMTGYPGFELAANYTYNCISDLGLNVSRFYYNVTVPYDLGANITFLEEGDVIKAYTMAPNFVAPPSTDSDGVVGPLVYVDDGSLENVDGKKINGSIVLMEFNTERRWLDLAMYGAKAVIFIAPESSTTYQFAAKSLEAPFRFPRVYISRSDGDRLRFRTGDKVCLKSSMRWETKRVSNIIATLEGSDPNFKNTYILVSAYIDSISWVPTIAPGAQESVGLSVLLELAKFLAANRPKYSILFAAYSGHNQYIEGSRQFVEYAVFNEEGYRKIGGKVALVLNLDLNSDTDFIGPVRGGGAYEASLVAETWETGEGSAWLLPRMRQIVQEMQDQLGRTYNYDEQGTISQNWDLVYVRIMPFLDHEPWLRAGGRTTCTLGTLYSGRIGWWGTPLDVFESINFRNLWPQIECIYSTISELANDEELKEKILIPKYLEITRWGKTREYATLTGTVATWNETKGWYEPISGALVFGRVQTGESTGGGGARWIDNKLGLYEYMITKSDKEGKFYFCGIPLGVPGGTIWGVDIYAFVVDEEGRLLYAPDLGRYKYAAVTATVDFPLNNIGFLTVFKCGTIVLFDFIDPQSLTLPEDISQAMDIYSYSTHAEPLSWGLLIPNARAGWIESVKGRFVSTGRNVATAFVPEIPVEIVLRTTYAQKYPLLVLTNSSRDYAGGFLVKSGEQMVLTPVNFGSTLYWLDERRLAYVVKSGIWLDTSDHKGASQLLSSSLAALQDLQYSRSWAYAIEAWSVEQRFYAAIKAVIEDTANTAPYFVALMIPFILIAERFFIGASGNKRLLSTVTIGFAIVALFFAVHPGFAVAVNPSMIFVAVLITVLILPLLGIISTGLLDITWRLRAERMGAAETRKETSRLSLVMMAFSVGVEGLKKRKIRTGLTIVTIIILVLGVVTFMSIIPVTMYTSVPISQVGPQRPYAGIELRHKNFAALSVEIGQLPQKWLGGVYGSDVILVPRAWLYSPARPEIGTFIVRSLVDPDYTYEVKAALGLPPEALEAYGLEFAMLNGTWFPPGVERACVLTKHEADQLKVNRLPAEVSFLGLNLTVVGIIDGEAFSNVRDLDQEALTPIVLGRPQFNIHLAGDMVIVLTYETVVSLGGGTFALSAVLKDPAVISDAAREIRKTLPRLLVYVSDGTQIRLYWYQFTSSVLGVEQQIVPIAIGMLVILNLMLSSIYERKKDIFIYSSLGLSPTQISYLFLSEALAFAVTGSLIGYVAAMTLSKAMSMTIGMYLNYSSTWVLIGTGTAMLVTVASTLYPTILASKLVTPSLERVWKAPTKPKGNEWVIPLPFRFESEREVGGVAAYIIEFINTHRTTGSEVFMIAREPQYGEMEDEKAKMKEISTSLRLEPYEASITQDVRITFSSSPTEPTWQMEVFARRTGGLISIWEKSNLMFVDRLRKAILTWRSLGEEELKRYEKIYLQKGMKNE